ncbi:MAG: tetratricopeptide repeat protein [Bacteroidetes bacterium]|nr:tetratricopeptide repeat protein [Bacteroidota bacterium]
MKKHILFILLWFITFSSNASPVDSLLKILNTASSQNSRIETLARISWEYRAIGEYDKAMSFAEEALNDAKKVNFKKGMADAYNAFGAIYDEKGDYTKSLDYYTQTLKIHEELKDDKGICRDMNNIGLLYENLNNYNTALSYYEKALDQAKKFDDKAILSAINFNIGAIYTYTENYKKSTEYYLKSLEIDEKLKDDIAISDCYVNLGINYSYLSQFDKAIEYSEKGLAIKQRLNDLNGVGAAYYNIGDVYYRQGKFQQAIENYQKTLELCLKTGIYDNTRLAYSGLANANYKLGNYKAAFDYHVRFKQVTDSVFNAANNEELNQTKINYELEKKQAEQEQINALAESAKKRQNIIIAAVVIVLLTVSVFSLFLYKRFKVTNRQKEIISQQKELVEEKQKEISDSINYAKRIQTSFLANKQEFEKYLSDYFILFKPKDVVSGDFYWACGTGSKIVICVADSTGHGIPGAFMSLLNISLLNEAVLSRHYTSTVDILNFVRKILMLGLKQDETGQGGNDGMDCVLFSIDTNTLEMEFSGAYNPLWIIRDGVIMELKANKMPVGRSPKESESFTSQIIQLQKNDLIYAFTDGYADQFGGPSGKKFKYKQLEEILLRIHQQPFKEQEHYLNQAFEDWKANLEQVDDVTILGFKI